MEKKIVQKINPFFRDDGYNPSVKCDDPFQEKWIHKQVVVKTGDGEDDFVIEEKPVMIDKINLQEQINEAAKDADLESMLRKLLLQSGTITGDEPELNVRPGFYGDITQVQSMIENHQDFISPEVIKQSLPDELKKLSVEELATLTDEELVEYMKKVRSSLPSKEENKVEEVKDNTETEVK